MSMRKKLTLRGIIMLVLFFGVLTVIFSPVFPGKVNGLDYLDNLFNMISKGSSDFIAQNLEESQKFSGNTIDATITLKDEIQASEIARQITISGLTAAAEGNKVHVNGDMAKLAAASLEDSKHIFANYGEPLVQKYAFIEQQAMYNWWVAFGSLSTELNKQQKFKEAKFFSTIQKKSLEPAYNYYGIESIHWQDNIVLILVALGFYVAYTVWYGFGLLYLFEGLGLKVGH